MEPKDLVRKHFGEDVPFAPEMAKALFSWSRRFEKQYGVWRVSDVVTARLECADESGVARRGPMYQLDGHHGPVLALLRATGMLGYFSDGLESPFIRTSVNPGILYPSGAHAPGTYAHTDVPPNTDERKLAAFFFEYGVEKLDAAYRKDPNYFPAIHKIFEFARLGGGVCFNFI